MPATDDPDRTPAEPARPGPSGNEATPEQVDAEFARIVAGFDTPLTTRTWPAGEEPPAGPPAPAGPVWPAGGPILNRPALTGDPRGVSPGDPSLLDSLDTFGSGLPDDTPDEFVPPPPPPLPRVPFAAIVAVLSIVFGFVLFFDTRLLPFNDRVSMLFALVCILGGATALIMRLRPGDEDDELPPDDGAVV
ncbi:DUF308 domain-containing protein [Catellatospora citrea]|uniref:DUF308 domain-containing protein n=1 Tax=Catellatospora citrea TaxID=53366 RepID=A0A8J3KDR0_9ACTN|nr:DUF308 domain-containing protein [Catellatospora citrea]RKE07173.1 hypothetical protein C8E86_1998 [Catellatospora citrea]GIF95325.1 hypothetical protein Cci01nite_04190 [Catellatospora citrea]